MSGVHYLHFMDIEKCEIKFLFYSPEKQVYLFFHFRSSWSHKIPAPEIFRISPYSVRLR